ncbi:putative ribonuclease H-like domain-containing protein [Tanacetum coccineum]
MKRSHQQMIGLDEYAIRKKIIESKTTKLNTDTSKYKTSETVGKTNEVNIEKPMSVHELVVPKPKINRDKVIIEDWYSDDVSEVNTVSPVKTNETQTGNPEICLQDHAVCPLLSPSLKLLDENQVVLRAPRQNGVYSLDLKNIVPSGEFKNHDMNEFCAKKGIKREFSVARTPQQNGVAERKNRTLIEAARTMLADSLLPIPFWAKAVNTACYVLNRVLVTKPQNKTPYELLIGKPPSISFIRPFGCPLTILNTLDPLGKFDGKSDEGYLLGYFNTRSGPNWMFDLDFLTNIMNYIPVSVENQVNVNAGTQEHSVACSSEKDKEPTQEYILLPLHPHRPRILVEDVVQAAQEKPFENSPKDNDVQDSEDVTEKEEQHTLTEAEQALKDDLERMTAQEIATKAIDDATRQSFKEEKKRAAQATSINKLNTSRPSVSTSNSTLVSTANTPYASAASTPTGANTSGLSFVYLRGQIPIDASTLPNVDLPIDPNMPDLEDDSNVFPNDGIFSGAYDDEDVGAEADFNNIDNTIDVSPIPTLRVHKDHPKDYDEVFAPVARIEAIRLFLAFASFMGFHVYQMDVKSAFLYGTIEEEVYVHQPPSFVDPAHPNKVYKVIKALYGLHKAPRAWYETLSSFLLKNGFRRGTIDKTLFIKKNKSDIMLVQVKQQPDGIFISQDKYVADILKKFDFCSIKTATTPIASNKPMVKDEDGVDVDVHVYRSMIGSLMYLTASRPDIMFVVCACARFQVTPKTSQLNAVKRIFRYLKHQPKLGLWYPRDSRFKLEAFLYSDYGGASLDRKLTIGGCQFLGRRLISWQCKKQTIVANSTIEVEYVAIANCCGQQSVKRFPSVPIGPTFPAALSPNKKVMTFMVKKGKNFLGKVTPLFDSMLVQQTEDKGEASERPSDSQPIPSPPHPSEDQPHIQTDLFPRPSPSIVILDSNPEGSGGNHGGQSSSDTSLSWNEDGLTLQSVKKLKKGVKALITHHKAWMKSVALKTRLARKASLKKKGVQKEYVSKQGRKYVKSSKGEPSVHKDPAFDDLDDDAMDYMETEDSQDEGRTSSMVLEKKESSDKEVSTEDPISTVKPNEGTDKRNEGTDKQDKGTDSIKVSTDRQGEGIADQNEGKSTTQTAPTTTLAPTLTIFGDDETIEQVLITMSQNKQKEKEKGVEIRNVEDTERPRPTSTRFVLTLKPLPKINPKDKGKKMIDEEGISDTESDDITEAEKKFKMLLKYEVS